LRSGLAGFLDVDEHGAGDDGSFTATGPSICARLPNAFQHPYVLERFDVKPLIFANYVAKSR
jgi:hypothetical protein